MPGLSFRLLITAVLFIFAASAIALTGSGGLRTAASRSRRNAAIAIYAIAFLLLIGATIALLDGGQ